MFVTESKESFWDKVLKCCRWSYRCYSLCWYNSRFCCHGGFGCGGPGGAWYAGSAIATIRRYVQNGSSSGFEIPLVYGKNVSLFFTIDPRETSTTYEYAIVKL